MNRVPCLNDGFVQLIDHMGSDASICNAARVSYGNHQTEPKTYKEAFERSEQKALDVVLGKENRDRNLIRYLMRHRHTTPFEMVSFIFLVRAPIHVARQWFRHRTWSYNEYSTRYKEAIDSFETTDPDKWRTQATNNKQGSGGYITDWPEGTRHADNLSILPSGKEVVTGDISGYPETKEPGQLLSYQEDSLHKRVKREYQERLELGVAREQARKDLPLSTYTEFYAKVDLHNLFHFLSLRLDSHAQLEIRTYAEAISGLIKPIVPISHQAFEDYRLNGAHFSSQEMKLLRGMINSEGTPLALFDKPDLLSDREWNEFKEKLCPTQ